MRQELAELLAEDVAAARHRADTAFDAVRAGRPVVLVGAGQLGRRIARAMSAMGDPPVAFADGAAALRDTIVGGVRVMATGRAAQEFPDAAFVVTIWGARSAHRIADSEARLQALGVGTLAPFTHLMWKLRASLPHYLVDLPHHVLEQRADAAAALDLFADDASRREYVAQVRARLTGRLDALGPPVSHEAYMPDDLVAWRPDERVIDGGAFDGDTLGDWIRHRGDSFAAWLAVEPHPSNADALDRAVARLPAGTRARVRVIRSALGASHGSVRFDADAGAGAAAHVPEASPSGPGMRDVSVTPLDALDAAAGASFVKLDIEGAELDALEGMRRIVARDRPVLAVCAYHRQDHLWRVPLAIAGMRSGDAFHLRPHGAEGWDVVCYAIPQERRS